MRFAQQNNTLKTLAQQLPASSFFGLTRQGRRRGPFLVILTSSRHVNLLLAQFPHEPDVT